MIVHATSVAVSLGDGVFGVALFGPAGSGKSDLALRLIDSCPFQKTMLIADDRTLLTASDGVLTAIAPPRIAGLLEVRGVGVIASIHARPTPIVLAVECLDRTEDVERIPLQRSKLLCGIAVLAIGMNPFEASAPAKVRVALRAVVEGLFRGDTALSEDRTV